jgi:hypothetical protein
MDQTENGPNPPPTAEQIAAWFQEWASQPIKRRERQRQTGQMPTEAQCQPIADLIVKMTTKPPNQPGGMIDVCSLVLGITDDQFSRESKAKLNAVIEAAKKADSALRGLRSWMDKQGEEFKNRAIPQEFAELQRASDAVLEKWKRKRGVGQPIKFDSFMVPMRAKPYAEACKAALVAAGWRRNISTNSEAGPVMFVVTKIMHNLGLTNWKPRTVGRRFREL